MNQVPVTVTLADLVHHRQWVDHRTPLAEVQKRFQTGQVEYFAILEDGRVRGLCSRATVGMLLGSRYGFALHGNSPVWTARTPRPLIFTIDAHVEQILDVALSRRDSEFFEDVILVNPDQSLRGLVPVPDLARLQLQLFADRLHRIAVQDEELRQQNLELFEVNQQLSQSQGRYQTLFENSALGVALLDRHGIVMAHNLRFTELVQDDAAPATNRPPLSLEQLLADQDRIKLRLLLTEHERHAPAPYPSETELRFRLRGMVRDFQLHSSWVAATGQICVCIADITDRRLLERSAARQDKQDMLDTLVAGVAHELNNKLTPVLGFADLLHAVTPAEYRLHTDCIRQGAEEAAKIIRQLLSLSRPEGPTQDQFDLKTVCQEVLQMLCFQLRETACEADLEVDDDPVLICGDAAQIKQVLINLVLNSLHAMEGLAAPRIFLTVRTEGSQAMLRIRDVGCGIPTELLDRIFDPFFTTKGPKGTGLGLSISASIIRQHAGEIAVESPPGCGASFTIRLPLSSHISPSRQMGTRSFSSTAPLAASGAERKRALVVDDEEYVRQFVQEALRRCFGCSVDTAADGQEAVDLLSQQPYHLIISDIRMPRMDGLELQSWLLTHRPALAGNLVFVTGNTGSLLADDRLAQSPCPVVRKPFTLDAIRQACHPILQSALN